MIDKHHFQMTTTKLWKFSCLILAICCAALLYRVFDLGITRTYEQASQDGEAMYMNQLRAVLLSDWSHLDEQQVREKIRAYAKLHPDDAVFEKHDTEEDALVMGQLSFKFKQGKLVDIR